MTRYEFLQKQVPEKRPKIVPRLPLLSYLASRPSTDCISYFLRHPNCDMNVRDENGWTPLIWAIRYGNRDFISEVLRRDEPLCDVNYSDPNGWTAFDHAAVCPDVRLMRMIVSTKTFDRNAGGSNGCRPRTLRAFRDSSHWLTKRILDEGCDPNLRDNKGR